MLRGIRLYSCEFVHGCHLGFQTRVLVRNNHIAADPLRIAFFGSDNFSCRSLQALLDLKKENPELIHKLDVITRPAKPSGRYRSDVKANPISSYAQLRGLNLLEVESKKDFLDLSYHSYNLAVAVSYGKLIPESFLNTLKFNGLNVHPSLLPKYSGPAPIHHALMNGDKHTGVTIQTLHPSKFDRGFLIKQSAEIPIAESDTIDSLRRSLAVVGGNMLSDVIRHRSFLTNRVEPKYEFSHAFPIKTSMGMIDWKKNDTDRIIHLNKAIDPLHTFISAWKKGKALSKRVLLRGIKKSDVPEEKTEVLKTVGQFKLANDNHIMIKTIDGYISVETLQFEGFTEETGDVFIRRLRKRAGKTAQQVFT